MLKKGWYLINDHELFLFAARGFWDRKERMETYMKVMERYLGEQDPRYGLPEISRDPEAQVNILLWIQKNCITKYTHQGVGYFCLSCDWVNLMLHRQHEMIPSGAKYPPGPMQEDIAAISQEFAEPDTYPEQPEGLLIPQ